MIKTRFSLVTTVIITAIFSITAHASQVQGLADAEILGVLKERVEIDKKNSGIVVAIIDSLGSRIFSVGVADKISGHNVDGNTVFEIGSLSKLFTSLILADMLDKGEVRLSDPVQIYLPNSVTVPVWGDHKITLLDLSTHMSGLPREPNNYIRPGVMKGYSASQLYTFLSAYRLQRDIGVKAEYSNLGAGLLGHALSLKGGSDFDTLLHTRVLNPLLMQSTAIVADKSMLERRAIGYSSDGQPAPYHGDSVLAGAGAIQSSANDMLKFLSLSMMQNTTPLTRAMAVMQKPLANRPDVHLAWGVGGKYNSEIWSHTGKTSGFVSYLGFDKTSNRGVIVLSNSAVSVEDIGAKILNRKFRLRQYSPPAVFVKELERNQYSGVRTIYDKFVSVDADFFLDEEVLNEWAYRVLTQGQVDYAIELFKLAVQLRPKSANVYDSLAEAYEKKGELKLAVDNYSQVIKIDPDNIHAKERLKALNPQ